MTALSEKLSEAMWRAGVGAQTLSKLTGVPRTAIDNWRAGTVRRPRHWRPLLQIARVLSLTRAQADELLRAAGHSSVAELAAQVPAGHPDRVHLGPWVTGGDQPGSWYQLRAPAADFTGRDEALRGLLEVLGRMPDAAVSAIAGIRGMGGVGKTELALLAAHRARAHYPDGQLVVQLRGISGEPAAAGQVLRRIIHVFAPDLSLEDDVEALQQRYCSVLSGRRVLILADDAADAGQVRPLLPPPGSALLVTSRNRFVLPGMSTVDLGQLAEAEAVRMLKGICARISEEEAGAIARACGFLPLALRISGSVLANDPALAVPSYVAALADRRQRLASLRDPDDAQLDLAASLGLSYARLSRAEAAVLGRLSVLTTDFAAELADAVQPEGTQTPEALRLLLRRNLIGFDPGRDRWQMHDLVRDLAHHHLTADGDHEPTMWRYAEAGLQLAMQIQQQYRGGDRAGALARFDAERSHVDTARQWIAEHAGQDRADRMLVADATVISQQIASMRYDRRGEITPQAKLALTAARRLGDARAQRRLLNRLGQMELDLGDARRAVEYFEQDLELAVARAHQYDEMCALNNLGLACTQSGDPRQAIHVHRRQILLALRLGDRKMLLMAQNNLAGAYLRRGAVKAALRQLTRALTGIRELGDRSGEGYVSCDLGLAWMAAGEVTRARELLEIALEIAREEGDRRGEAQALAQLGRVATRLGDPAAGTRFGESALALAEELGSQGAQAEALRTLGESRSDPAALAEALALLRAAGHRGEESECAWELGLVLLLSDPVRAGGLWRASLAHQAAVGHHRYQARLALYEEHYGMVAQTLPVQPDSP